MAIRKIYNGSVGPFLYDDTDPIDDPDGDFPGEPYRALTTNDQIFVGRAPAVDEEVLRLIDLGYRLLPPVVTANINNPAELNAVAGIPGTMVLAYEIVGAGGQNEYTMYAYDASGPAVNSPYVVDADGAGAERWIALAGKYFAQNLNISGNILLTGTVDGVDIAVFAAAYVAHIANVNAHHNQIHLVSSHPDTNLAGIANNDLWQWNDPALKWVPRSIQEIILNQNINPGDVTISGDLVFDSAGKGLPYGEIYYMGAGFDTGLVAQDTYYQILGFDTDGISNLATPDHTNDHITITKTGAYQVQFSISGRSANPTTFQFMVRKNNGTVALTNIMVHRTTSAANRVATGACTGLVALTAGDTIELWIQRVTGAAVNKIITLEHVVLNLVMIGG